MEIKGHSICTDDPYFIAEAGVNHNGKLELAEDLIDIAADAGADAVKFQTFSTDRLVTQHASKADYQQETTDDGSQYEMLKQYELGEDAHKRLIDYCSEKEITFLSTPFDRESAEMLAEFGIPAIKVGSGELNNYPLLKHIANLDLPMIISTGMGTMEEVHAAHDIIRSGNSAVDLAFLHCTSAYPAAVEDVNLRAMQTMGKELPVPVGYSDHTTLSETPALAVAAGACIVEKHFTIDSTLPGPDHEASLEPEELRRCVNLVEFAAKSLGSDNKKPVEAELENRVVARKSLHTARDVDAGTELKKSDVKIVRPAEGISPREYHNILGKQVRRSVPKNKPLTEDDLAE